MPVAYLEMGPNEIKSRLQKKYPDLQGPGISIKLTYPQLNRGVFYTIFRAFPTTLILRISKEKEERLIPFLRPTSHYTCVKSISAFSTAVLPLRGSGCCRGCRAAWCRGRRCGAERRREHFQTAFAKRCRGLFPAHYCVQGD